MDETIVATQGTPPVTEQSSDGGKGSTSTETYTKEQVEKQISDALAKAGRDAKSLAERESALKTQEAANKAERESIAKWQADREKEEFESVKDDPDAVTLLQRKKALRESEVRLAEDRATFEREKAAHAEKLTKAEETEREILIFKLAGDKIDPAKLLDLSNKFNARSEEQIQTIVETLASEVKPDLTLKPDSSATTGSGGKSDERIFDEMYPTMKKKK